MNFDAARRIANEAISLASLDPDLSPGLETVLRADPQRTVRLLVFSVLARLPDSRTLPSIPEERIHSAVRSALLEAGKKPCAQKPVSMKAYIQVLATSLTSGELRPHLRIRSDRL